MEIIIGLERKGIGVLDKLPSGINSRLATFVRPSFDETTTNVYICVRPTMTLSLFPLDPSDQTNSSKTTTTTIIPN